MSYAGNNSATLLVWGPQLEKGSLPSVYTSPGMVESIIDPLNGWTGSLTGNLGKSPVVSGDGFGGGSLAFSVDEWLDSDAKGADMGVGGSNPRTVCFWMFVPNGQQSESGMYGYGTRSCTDGRNNMWALRSLWGGSNYTRFRSALVLGSQGTFP